MVPLLFFVARRAPLPAESRIVRWHRDGATAPAPATEAPGAANYARSPAGTLSRILPGLSTLPPWPGR